MGKAWAKYTPFSSLSPKTRSITLLTFAITSPRLSAELHPRTARGLLCLLYILCCVEISTVVFHTQSHSHVKAFLLAGPLFKPTNHVFSGLRETLIPSEPRASCSMPANIYSAVHKPHPLGSQKKKQCLDCWWDCQHVPQEVKEKGGSAHWGCWERKRGGGCFEMQNSCYEDIMLQGWGKTRWTREKNGKFWVGACSRQCHTRVSSVWMKGVGGPRKQKAIKEVGSYKKAHWSGFVSLRSVRNSHSWSWHQCWCLFGRLCTHSTNV